jgi:ribonuclease BN (tRNA processing enzyme)
MNMKGSRIMTAQKQLKIWTDPSLAEAFKKVCTQSGLSMSSELSSLMKARIATSTDIISIQRMQKLSTRRDRRKTIRHLINVLSLLIDAEERYIDNIPENLKNAPAHENALETLDALEQALSLLDEAY